MGRLFFKNRQCLKKSQAGFSLIEAVIGSAIMGGLLLVYLQLSQIHKKSSSALQFTIARMDLEKSLITSMSNGSLCSFILSDSTQSSTASPANRSKDVLDATSLTAQNPAVINIKRIPANPSANSPLLAEVGQPATLFVSKLIISSMAFKIKPNQPPDIFLADFYVSFDHPFGTNKPDDIVIKNIKIATDSLSPANAKKILSCSGWGESKAQRYTFTTTTNWTVPVGARKAFVTMAGGGGSGLGWRIISNIITGHSGGYAFSQPVNLTPGEVMQVIVGKGGKGYPAISTGVPASPGPPYYIYTNPINDDGLGGYPGEPSKLISPVQGVLLECAGGSGATVYGIDSYSGGVVAGNVPGALTGGGVPVTASPNRMATGSYALANGPGACGPGPLDYGRGNSGISLWGISSGNYSGGTTPFGFGSGGDIWVSGCYVSSTIVGTCIFPQDGKDGVVYIDVW